MILFARYLIIKVTTAEPEKILTNLADANIELNNILWVDHLTVEIRIKFTQYSAIQRMLDAQEIRYEIISRPGILWRILSTCKRPVLVLGLLLFSVLALWLPGRILFIEIVGNETISDMQVRQNVEACGIYSGIKSADLRSENIKNLFLAEVPNLQWVGVTTSGCVATIHIKERSAVEEIPQDRGGVSSIVASADGIISQMTVFNGNPLVNVGQSVKAGDVLISGYIDYGIKTSAQQAKGEVFAYTEHTLKVIFPRRMLKKGIMMGKQVCYRLQVGKKVINLCNHSGISDSTCGKMYSEYYWSLPGGFRLPICLTKVVCCNYNTTTGLETDLSAKWVQQNTRKYLHSKMIAGNILKESFTWNVTGDYCEFNGKYACHEMIGLKKHEEIIG